MAQPPLHIILRELSFSYTVFTQNTRVNGTTPHQSCFSIKSLTRTALNTNNVHPQRSRVQQLKTSNNTADATTAQSPPPSQTIPRQKAEKPIIININNNPTTNVVEEDTMIVTLIGETPRHTDTDTILPVPTQSTSPAESTFSSTVSPETSDEAIIIAHKETPFTFTINNKIVTVTTYCGHKSPQVAAEYLNNSFLQIILVNL